MDHDLRAGDRLDHTSELVIKGGNHAWTTTSELAIKGGNHGQHMVYDLRGDNQGMLDHDLGPRPQR